MGGSQSQQIKRQQFTHKDWEEIPLVSYTNNVDPYYSSKFKVLSHRNKKYLQAQQYNLYFNSQAQFQSYLQLYNTRKHSPFLVNSIHIEQTTQRNMCATFHTASLYLERIPLRLFQITDVPLTEGMYMFQCAFEGYETILQKTGYFDISPDMICINQQGKVKVWLNRNLSKNFPDFNRIDHNKNQSDFLKKVIEVIEESIDYDSFQSFSEFLYSKFPIPTFKVAKMVFKEYCRIHEIVPSKVMRSVLIIYKGNFHYDEKQKDQSLKTTKPKTQNFARKSFQKSPSQLRSKPCFKGSTVSGTLHMSFIKNPHEFNEFDHIQHYPSVQKKNPSVAFYYKNTGLYSPQNNELKQSKRSIWRQEMGMKTRNREKSSQKGKKKQNFVKKKEQGDNLYFNTQKMIEIDPDIAKDLQALNI